MTTQPGEQPSARQLVDREQVLAEVTRVIEAAWNSFDEPRPTEPVLDEALLARMNEPLPLGGGDVRAAIDDAANILDASVSPSRPLFLAYVGSSGLEIGVLAHALAATYDANVAANAGGADLVERQGVQWLAELVGYPLGEGVFTSGGMISNLTALLAAREAALPGSRDDGLAGVKAAVYCSDEAHHSVVRAVETCGLGNRSIRKIPADDRHRMIPELLERAIEHDQEAGVLPLAVVATGGTTLTGSVDPLDAISDICERHGIWLHVDGAYGLPAAATDRARPVFAGLDRVDSVTMDVHKWLGLQKSCSVLFVKRKGALRAAFGHEERYMLHDEDIANPVDLTLEYSRPVRSIKPWLALRVHGAEQMRRWITRTLESAAHFTDLVREADDFELLHEPMLSTICFRHIPPGVTDPDELDAHNRRLAAAMMADGRVYLAPAALDGKVCLRVCFVNFRTTPEQVEFVIDVARELSRGVSK